MELAIDTSTGRAGVALTDQGLMSAGFTWQCRQNHTVELVPTIASLLQHSRMQTSDIRGVFIAKGPGSYNGLRAGMSTAKALAFSLGIPLVAVGTLELEAYLFAAFGLPIRPVQRAMGGQVATALYEGLGAELVCQEKERLVPVSFLNQLLDTRTILCGETAQELSRPLEPTCRDNALVPPISASRLSALAALGWARMKAGRADNAATLEPLYLRAPHISIPNRKGGPIAAANRRQ